jgi:hypothetical protein
VPEGFEAGWHTVRPGETLEAIAARYLGSSGEWRRLQRLNPGINDANRIEPGQRIRVLIRQGVSPAAQLSRLSRQVEEQPSPIPWSEARVGDVLVERDGVRTYRKSSAELSFLDGTRLQVTEDSLVFLRRTGGNLKGVPGRRSVEIVEGQADLETRPVPGRPAASPEIEIVLGGTTATSRPGGAGTAQARARRSEEGGAKVMVYGGEGEVEAGGSRVQVPQGMGTSVAKEGPPSPPEKLLPSPERTAPESGAALGCANPSFSWEPVADAASYTMEVCRDAACAELVDRATGIAEAAWRAAALPAGDFHWRVTARSRSGLDGYPSPASALSILSDQADEAAPAGVLALAGTQVRVDGGLFVNTSIRPELTVDDSGSGGSGGSGGAKSLPMVNGREVAAWPQPWEPGEYTAGAVALDRCGNRAAVAPISFIVDGAPPEVVWEAGDRTVFADRLTPPEMVRREGRARREKRRRDIAEAAEKAPLAWSSGGIDWTPLTPLDAPLKIESDHPQLFLRSAGLKLVADGREASFTDGRLVWLTARDGESRVERMTLTPRQAPDGGMVLEVEVVDLVGNTTRKEWRLRR